MPRRLLLLLLVLGLAALLPAIASAQAPAPAVVTLTMPAHPPLGEPMTLTATLHDPAGAPIADAPLRFLLLGEFMGKSGQADLGRAITDATGVATLKHAPRLTGALTIRVIFDGTEDVPGAHVDLETDVVGDGQLYTVAFGTAAPNFEFWGLVVVLSAVWTIVLSVALRILAIARGGAAPVAPDTVPAFFRKREEWR